MTEQSRREREMGNCDPFEERLRGFLLTSLESQIMRVLVQADASCCFSPPPSVHVPSSGGLGPPAIFLMHFCQRVEQCSVNDN